MNLENWMRCPAFVLIGGAQAPEPARWRHPAAPTPPRAVPAGASDFWNLGRRMKRYLLASDFDQTLASRLGNRPERAAGISDFRERPPDCPASTCATRAELAYLLLHDPEYRR